MVVLTGIVSTRSKCSPHRYADKYLWILRLCIVVLLITISCCGGACSAPPHGVVISSVLVDPAQYTPNGGRYDLLLQTTPGSKVTRLIDHQAAPKLKLGGAISEPLFSHDGKRVVFLANYTGSDKDNGLVWTGVSPNRNALLNVWEIRLDTRKVSPMTTGDLGWCIYGWSPDDHYVCATYQTALSNLDQDTPIPEDLYVWDMSTQKGQELARVPDTIRDAFWSNDGKHILYQTWANANLYMISRQGGKPKILLRGKVGRYGYSFSPDGRRVAYVDINTVYVANADGSKPELVIKMTRDEHSPYSPKPKWSRDGSKLALATYEPPDNAQVSVKLHVYDVSKGEDRVVATVQQFVSDPMWSRNGQWLMVKMSHTGNTEKPDPKTGWHTFNRQGLLAVSVADGHVVTLKKPNEETNGLDWFGTR